MKTCDEAWTDWAVANPDVGRQAAFRAGWDASPSVEVFNEDMARAREEMARLRGDHLGLECRAL